MDPSEQTEGKPTMRLSLDVLPLDLIVMNDGQLDKAIAATEASVNAPTLLQRLKDERERRQAEARAKAAEIVSLVQECASLFAEAEHVSAVDLDALERTPEIERTPELYRRARMSWRLAFSRAHDLFHATHEDRRFYRPYRLPEAFRSMREPLPPVEDADWKAKIARLVALKGPKVTAIANGG